MISRYQQDLDFVTSALEDGYIFLGIKEKEWGYPFEEVKRAFEQRLSKITSDLGFWLLLRELVASLHDGHTGIGLDAAGITRPYPSILPFEIKDIAGQYYVSGWRDDTSSVREIEIGDEVISIGGFTTEALLQIYERYQGASTRASLPKAVAQGPHVIFNYFLPHYDFDAPLALSLLSGDGKQKRCQIPWVSVPKKAANPSPTNFVSYRWLRQDPRLAYLRMRDFYFPGRENVQTIKEHLNTIFSEIREAEGVLLDIRHNDGGTPTPFFDVISRLIQDPLPNFKRRWLISGSFLKYHDYRYRFADRKGLTEWEFDGSPGRETIVPSPEYRLSKGVSIVIMVDWATCSRAEQLPVMFREAGIATIFGERTSGADACPLRISLPSTGWRFSFSVGECRSAKGYNIEGNGVIPDVPFICSPEDLGAQRDRHLEEAEHLLLELI